MKLSLIFPLLLLATHAFAACPEAPPAVKDIRANSYYSDAAGSVIDKALYEQYKRNIDPITEFHRKVLEMADSYLANNDQEAGRCAVTWLTTWMRDGALTGQIINERGTQANYIQKWTLAGVAMATFKVRELLSPQDHAIIDPWLREQSARAIAFWNDGKHKRNNHYYWSALAVEASAAAAHDDALWKKARSMYEESIDHIAKDGTLHQEMARAGLALHYHNYALMPLAAMAELARFRGEDWYAVDDGRLLRLAELVADGLQDPSWFAAQTGKEQKVPAEGNLCWTVWLADQPLRNADKVKQLAAGGPFVNSQSGGNAAMTRLSVRRSSW